MFSAQGYILHNKIYSICSASVSMAINKMVIADLKSCNILKCINFYQFFHVVAVFVIVLNFK